MPNGDDGDLEIKGLKVTALPKGSKVKTQKIGRNNYDDEYRWSLDLNNVPEGTEYLTIQIKTDWN